MNKQNVLLRQLCTQLDHEWIATNQTLRSEVYVTTPRVHTLNNY